MIKSVARWLVFFVIGFVVSRITWLLAPIICLFYRKELRTDTVKRFNKQVKSFDREYVCRPFAWASTHDNAADEYFWGWYKGDWLDKLLFGKPTGEWTIAEYDESWLKRYWCRVRWMWRNSAYKFSHDILGFHRESGYRESVTIYKNFVIKKWVNLDGSAAFLVVGGFGFEPFNNIRVGWKENKGFSKLMLAGRIISFRDK